MVRWLEWLLFRFFGKAVIHILAVVLNFYLAVQQEFKSWFLNNKSRQPVSITKEEADMLGHTFSQYYNAIVGPLMTFLVPSSKIWELQHSNNKLDGHRPEDCLKIRNTIFDKVDQIFKMLHLSGIYHPIWLKLCSVNTCPKKFKNK